MGKKIKKENDNQLNFLDIIDNAINNPEVARSMLYRKEYRLHRMEPWMQSLMPSGEYYIIQADHPLVLCRTDDTDIAPEMLYRHYKIGGIIYAATGVGRDYDCDEELSECELAEGSNPVLYEIGEKIVRPARMVTKNPDGSYQGIDFGFVTGFERHAIAKLMLGHSFKEFWFEKAKEEGANLLLYNGLDRKEAGAFVRFRKHSYVNDMTSSFAAYLTGKALPDIYMMDFQNNPQ